MIICYINGHVAYPAAQSDVKITLQNPFVKDGDEKTMEVVFPMDIAQNREVFGALNRLDTHFRMDNYENCRLMTDGQEIIAGVGTITSVSNTEVKLQILSGQSYLRYKASFDKVYIDQIDYGDLSSRHQFLKGMWQRSKTVYNMASDLNSQGFIGEPGKYAFLPIHDETNDIFLNMPVYYYVGNDYSDNGVTTRFAAVQPNLMYVMKKVMQRMGYNVRSNAFDVEPWNKLYVASALQTTVLNKALPHWSCYKFLEEFRKLFNATYLFNENQKTVDIIPFGESGNAGTVTVEPLEEFSTSFDEEGVEYLGSSNIEFKLSDCDRDYDCLSQDVLKAFEKLEYDDINSLYQAWENMTVKDKMTHIFHCPIGYFYGVTVEDDDGNVINHLLKECGWFSPMVRREGASTVELNIVPVAIKKQKCNCYSSKILKSDQGNYIMWRYDTWEYEAFTANITCENQVNAELKIIAEEGKEPEGDYVSVMDVVEYGDAIPDDTSEDTVMEVFFAANYMQVYQDPERKEKTDLLDWYLGYEIKTVRQPTAFCDYRHAVFEVSGTIPQWSMGLMPLVNIQSIGAFHNAGLKIRQNVNGNNEICVKFLYNGKPDPRKIYIIRNRKFLCSHIDMAVGENGIDPVKTGYFYEIL